MNNKTKIITGVVVGCCLLVAGVYGVHEYRLSHIKEPDKPNQASSGIKVQTTSVDGVFCPRYCLGSCDSQGRCPS